MTITISAEEWGNNWQSKDWAGDSEAQRPRGDRTVLRRVEHTDPADSQDVIYRCQPQYGQGYHRLIQLPEISITIFDEYQ